jgi:hypothetical protein
MATDSRGAVPKKMAEITPVEPEQGNACAGKDAKTPPPRFAAFTPNQFFKHQKQKR